MGKIIDLTGKVYSRLTVVKFHGIRNYKTYQKTFWECLCICGQHCVIEQGNLNNGHTKSCGCLSVENRLNGKKTHELTGTKEYQAWSHAKNRCYNVNDKRYQDYGGRGIRMCKRWIKSFENFFADMGVAPSKAHTLDRKNNDLGYGPDNCRWATPKEQANNRRSNILITYNGETKNIRAWSESSGVPHYSISWRIKRGWPIDKVLS